MSKILEFPSGAKREARPAFTFVTLADYAAKFGDSVSKSLQGRDRDLDMSFAAKQEQHAQNARLLADEARSLNLPRVRWDLIQHAEIVERRSVELEAEHHEEA